MKIKASDFWRLDGTIDRGPYLLIGLLLCALKYNIDRLILQISSGSPWNPLNYWIPGDTFGVLGISPERGRVYFILLLAALPFMYVGIALTLRRLRAVGLPAWVVGTFFVPLLNLVIFAILSILPSKTGPGFKKWKPAILDRFIPHGRFGSAVLSVAISASLAAGCAYLFADQLGSYGWGLFVGVPFCLGLSSALIYGYHEPRSLRSSIMIAMLAVMLLAGLLFALQVEGIICILMAAPLAIPLALLGAAIGYLIQRRSEQNRAGRILAGIAILLPLLLGAESAAPPTAPLLEIRTAIDIDAPPERVWTHVVSFSELPPPSERLFRTGIAYPIRAEIQGRGVGSVRHCVFSIGAFVEPITVWDEPRLLKFSVTSQPPTLEEWTPYSAIHPPHVEGYFVSHEGQFLLTPLAGGRTRLEGTTWYTDRLWPAPYWTVWSDLIVHRIHERVLKHVKSLAERG